MTVQSMKAEKFKALHVKGDPVVLFNIWDVGTALTVAQAGAKALATGSAPVAMANGFPDGQQIPFEMALANVARITNVTDLPLTMDLEGGYATDPNTVLANVSRALDAGAIGFNFEDQIIGGQGLYPIDQQVGRVAVVRQACDRAGVPGFVNARTDIFLKAAPNTHSDEMLADAITRAHAYADAGADGFFAPGLRDEAMIQRLCTEVSQPVNIIALPGTPSNTRLAELGVARISYGPVPYRHMLQWLQAEARKALE